MQRSVKHPDLRVDILCMDGSFKIHCILIRSVKAHPPEFAFMVLSRLILDHRNSGQLRFCEIPHFPSRKNSFIPVYLIYMLGC